jgi:hypothetical protein
VIVTVGPASAILEATAIARATPTAVRPAAMLALEGSCRKRSISCLRPLFL